MKKLRAGVIGAGVGKKHIAAYREIAEVEFVALADKDPERLKEVSASLKIPSSYQDPLEMLRKEKLDIVSVATPNKFHKPLTIAALESGAHVLCEKPMALNAAEAKSMAAAAKKAKRRLMINFSYRFTEQAWTLKKEVEAGVLGEVYYGRTFWHRRRGIPGFGGWFTDKAMAGGGPLIDLGVHRLDLALWLMDYPKPVWVMAGVYDPIAAALAKEAGKKFDVEDLAAGMIRFDNGAMLSIEASWAGNIERQEWMETRLWGKKAGLVQRNVSDGSGFFGYTFESELYLDKDGALYDMKLQPPVPGVPTAQGHFVRSILENKAHIATADEGIRVMEILDALYESAKQKKPIQLH